jgi:hypothetical protein
MIIHHVSAEEIDTLQGMFAELTPLGWVVPDWRYF